MFPALRAKANRTLPNFLAPECWVTRGVISVKIVKASAR